MKLCIIAKNFNNKLENMKKTILILFIFSILCGSKIFAQESNATLEETLEWLKSKLDGQILVDEEDEAWQTTYSFDYNLKEKKIIFKTTEKWTEEWGGKSEIYITTINLCDIIDVHVSHTDNNPPDTTINIVTNEGLVKIEYSINNEPSETWTDNSHPLYHPDMNNIFERLVKAFNHAVFLCKKDEKF